MLRNLLVALLAAGFALAMALPALAQEDVDPADATLVEVVGTTEDFSTLLAAVEAADLVDALSAEGPLTLFAPTNDAFSALPDGALEALIADPETLGQVLRYHVVSGDLTASAIGGLVSATTIQGESVEFVVADDGTVNVNDATVIEADTLVANGVIHALDSVLLPPDVDLAALLPEAAAADVVSGVQITNTDGTTETVSLSELGGLGGTEPLFDIITPGQPLLNIAARLQTIDSFSTLVDALTAAELLQTFEGDGQFVLLAPDNDAFAKLPAADLEALLADPEGELTNILLYHVVAGEITDEQESSIDAGTPLEIETLQGATLTLSRDERQFLVNGDIAVSASGPASNGLIVRIDTVLIPPPSDEGEDEEEPGDRGEPESPITGIGLPTSVIYLLGGLGAVLLMSGGFFLRRRSIQR